jgi:predicted acetyltransferase
MLALTQLMTERGYPLAVLYAATIPIYRQLGWEVAGARYEAVIPARSLHALVKPDAPVTAALSAPAAASAPAAGPPLRRPGPADAAEIIDVIGRAHQAARDCGPITFTEAIVRRWLTAPGSYLDSDKFAYLAPDGFLAYRWSGGGKHDLYVDKAVAVSPETTRAFWSIVASHASVAQTVRTQVTPYDPIWWLLRERDATIAHRAQWMLRLLDAPAAIAARGYPPADLTAPLHITDDQVPANSGWWDLAIRSGSATLSRAPQNAAAAPLRVGARGLAALYAGTPVSTLRRAGLAAGGTPQADAALDGAFAASAFMLDDF